MAGNGSPITWMSCVWGSLSDLFWGSLSDLFWGSLSDPPTIECGLLVTGILGKIQYEITRKSRPHASSSLYTLIGREMKCIYIMKYEFEFVWTILKWSRHILDYTFRKKWDWNKREQGSLNDSWHSITNHRLKNNKGYQLLVEYVKTPHIWSWNLLGIFMTRTCCF